MKMPAIFLLLLLVALVTYGGITFRAQFEVEPIVSGPGVTKIGLLSDYHPPLKGTISDTEVYYLQGEAPGDTVFVLGGNHPNEPASLLTAVLLIENLTVSAGQVIIVPRGNASAFTHTGPQEAHPSTFTIPTPFGERWFRFGDRLTNPIHQWPDPDIYVHSSGETLAGIEGRNLNRSFPGKPDGTITQQVAYAITQLLIEEDVAVAIDIHEASPEYPVVNALVAHERGMDVAAMAILDLQMEGLRISLEPSPQNLRGLTHREWGDSTNTLAFLLETANPSMGRIRGRTDEALVVTGQDPVYHRASNIGALAVPVPEAGIHINERVARHILTIEAIINSYNFMAISPIIINNVPPYHDLITKGVGEFLKPVP